MWNIEERAQPESGLPAVEDGSMKRTITQISVSNLPAGDDRHMLVVLADDGSLWTFVSENSIKAGKWARLPGLPDETEDEVKERSDFRKALAREMTDKLARLQEDPVTYARPVRKWWQLWLT